MRKEINLNGWIPSDEKFSETIKETNLAINKEELFSASFKNAKMWSKNGKAKRLYVKVTISHEPIK